MALVWHTSGMAGRAQTLTFAALLLAACHTRSTRTSPAASSDAPAISHAEAAPTPSGDASAPTPVIERAPYKPASQLGEVLAIRKAKSARTVHAQPDADAVERGRIVRGESFRVFAEQPGPGCDRAWALVADAAWVCLERTEPSDVTPRALPVLEPGAIVPFIYARHVDHDELGTPPIPVYRNSSDYRSGAAPHASLAAYGSYAFTRLRPNHGDPLLITEARNVVRAADLELFEPSEFGGRELIEQPLPADRTLAWGVRWKTLVRRAPEPEAEVVARIKFHAELFVVGEGVRGSDGQAWFEVPATDEHAGGWVLADDIRRFIAVAPDEPLGGQITIDVDLDEQVLSVWLEDRPVFVTLISSGKINDQTPTGVYRIETKRAYGKMESLPHAREPYYVEAVPWVMYFQGRYALHAAYWHDMFGHRMSHGCVNLSPRDARRVFELASPRLPDGWLLVHEHAADPGAVVRIRKHGAELPDRRHPFDGSAPVPAPETD